MTSRFENDNAEQQQLAKWITKQLDESNENLSQQQLNDIAQARNEALRLLNKSPMSGSPSEGAGHWFAQVFSFKSFAYATPAVLLAVSVMLVTLNQETMLQTLPIELVNAEMPGEDLAMLEDLEFATWLAENSEEDLL